MSTSRSAYRLADAVAGRDQAIPFDIFNRHALDLSGRRGCGEPLEPAICATRKPTVRRLGRNRANAYPETETYNLDRKQHALTMIDRLNCSHASGC